MRIDCFLALMQGKNLFVLLESPSTALRGTKSFGKAAGNAPIAIGVEKPKSFASD